MATRHVFTVIGVVLLPACKLATEPRLVSIDPDYAYTDGCTEVSVSGSKLGVDATASIGGSPMENWRAAEEDPERGDRAQDVGFMYYGTTPAGAEGGTFVDLSVTVGDTTLVLEDGFYYRACPDGFRVESTSIDESHAPGDSIALSGCGMDPAELTAGLHSPSDFALVEAFDVVSDCRGALTHFDIPTIADGTYLVHIAHSNGTAFGQLCDPSDTGLDTAMGCAPVTITIANGGAQ